MNDEWTAADIEEYQQYLNERETDDWLVDCLDRFYGEIDSVTEKSRS